MPNRPNGAAYPETCESCGNQGMVKVDAPSRDGVTKVFKCPECGHTQPVDDGPGGGSYVEKR